MKPTNQFIKKMIKDEKEGAKLYRSHGFSSIAKDEKRHLGILQKELKKRWMGLLAILLIIGVVLGTVGLILKAISH